MYGDNRVKIKRNRVIEESWEKRDLGMGIYKV